MVSEGDQWIEEFVISATRNELEEILKLIVLDISNTKLKHHIDIKIEETP